MVAKILKNSSSLTDSDLQNSIEGEENPKYEKAEKLRTEAESYVLSGFGNGISSG